jgi:hypothetical protein
LSWLGWLPTLDTYLPTYLPTLLLVPFAPTTPPLLPRSYRSYKKGTLLFLLLPLLLHLHLHLLPPLLPPLLLLRDLTDPGPRVLLMYLLHGFPLEIRERYDRYGLFFFLPQ